MDERTGMDGRWDAFVREAPGASFRQSPAWAAVKATQGWSARRLVVQRDGAIVAGAQLLLKRLPGPSVTGSIAYCSHAPLLRDDDPQLAAATVDRLLVWCHRSRVRALVVQPPEGHQHLHDLLVRRGVVASPVPIAPRATVLVDLTRDLDDIERQLSKSLRNQLRRAVRKGVEVRRGGRDELGTFHRLLTSASERLRYAIFPKRYYERLWDVFAPRGDVQLFLAEVGGRVVSAQLCLVFGDTLHALALGWSGEHGNLSPNDLLDWHAVAYGKERGLRAYDLENISYDVARRLVAGEELAAAALKGSDRYKLKWSRDVVLFPAASLYVPNPVVRGMVRRVPPAALEPSLRRLTTQLRATQRA